jgi:uracil-DNA glycosylase
VDMNKYNQIVVADDSTVERDREYASVYRGHVQNHKVDIELMPMYHLSFYKYDNVINASQAYDKDVDSFNQKVKCRSMGKRLNRLNLF